MAHVHGLESLRISSGQYGSLRTYSCHNVKIYLRAARETNKEAWDVEELLQIIKQEVHVRET